MEDVRRKRESQYMPHIIRELEDIPGGGSVALADLDKSIGVIPPGFIVGRNGNGMLVVLISAVLVADATATDVKYKVKKLSQLKKGMFVTTGDVEGAKAYAITAISRTNEAYDEITLGTTLGVVATAGQTLHQVTEEDAVGGAGKLPFKPLGVAKNEVDLSRNHVDTGVTISGSVNVANMAFGAPAVYQKELVRISFR